MTSASCKAKLMKKRYSSNSTVTFGNKRLVNICYIMRIFIIYIKKSNETMKHGCSL